MKKIILILLLIVAIALSWAIFGSGLFLFKTNTPKYYSCYDILEKAYSSDKIDMDVEVSLDTTLPDISFDFNMVKIPYNDNNAIKYTLDTFLGDFDYYQIGNEFFGEDTENFPYTEIPDSLTNFLIGTAYLYNSGYTISSTEYGDDILYEIEIPDEEIIKLVDTYGGSLKDMDISFNNFTIIVTTEENQLDKVEINGSIKYTMLDKMDLSGDITIKAKINELGDDVEEFIIPDKYL